MSEPADRARLFQELIHALEAETTTGMGFVHVDGIGDYLRVRHAQLPGPVANPEQELPPILGTSTGLGVGIEMGYEPGAFRYLARMICDAGEPWLAAVFLLDCCLAVPADHAFFFVDWAADMVGWEGDASRVRMARIVAGVQASDDNSSDRSRRVLRSAARRWADALTLPLVQGDLRALGDTAQVERRPTLAEYEAGRRQQVDRSVAVARNRHQIHRVIDLLAAADRLDEAPTVLRAAAPQGPGRALALGEAARLVPEFIAAGASLDRTGPYDVDTIGAMLRSAQDERARASLLRELTDALRGATKWTSVDDTPATDHLARSIATAMAADGHRDAGVSLLLDVADSLDSRQAWRAASLRCIAMEALDWNRALPVDPSVLGRIYEGITSRAWTVGPGAPLLARAAARWLAPLLSASDSRAMLIALAEHGCAEGRPNEGVALLHAAGLADEAPMRLVALSRTAPREHRPAILRVAFEALKRSGRSAEAVAVASELLQHLDPAGDETTEVLLFVARELQAQDRYHEALALVTASARDAWAYAFVAAATRLSRAAITIMRSAPDPGPLAPILEERAVTLEDMGHAGHAAMDWIDCSIDVHAAAGDFQSAAGVERRASARARERRDAVTADEFDLRRRCDEAAASWVALRPAADVRRRLDGDARDRIRLSRRMEDGSFIAASVSVLDESQQSDETVACHWFTVTPPTSAPTASVCGAAGLSADCSVWEPVRRTIREFDAWMSVVDTTGRLRCVRRCRACERAVLQRIAADSGQRPASPWPGSERDLDASAQNTYFVMTRVWDLGLSAWLGGPERYHLFDQGGSIVPRAATATAAVCGVLRVEGWTPATDRVHGDGGALRVGSLPIDLACPECMSRALWAHSELNPEHLSDLSRSVPADGFSALLDEAKGLWRRHHARAQGHRER